MAILSEVLRVLRLEEKAIHDCVQRLEMSDGAREVKQAIEAFQMALDRGGKIIVTGVGKSGKVGQKIAATLCSTGSLAVFLHPTEGLHGDLGMIRADDVVLALSYTGNTQELVRLIPSLKRMRVTLVGLGGNSASHLAEQCDIWLDARVGGEACPHNLAPTSSTTLALALGDAIAMTLMKIRGFDTNSFAENHPGGSLGKRLSLRVSDLMHSGEKVPRVAPQASMEEVTGILTQKQLGAVLVIEGSQLVGVITDGDIRRALSYKEKFFHLIASQIMTQEPITAYPQMMAQEALRLMEDRPSQISVLPVVNEKKEWQGLLRLHDLVKAF